MKNFFFLHLLLALLCSNLSNCQPQPTEIKSITIKVKLFTTDKLGNFYVVNSRNELQKFDSTGKYLNTQSYKVMGNITSIDATNPLQVVLYYKQLDQAVLIDNYFQVKESISFINPEIGKAGMVCRSSDNGWWVWDDNRQRLKKFNHQMKLLFESDPLQFGSEQPTIEKISECNNHLYLLSPSHGIILFDWFGKYHSTLPFKGASSLQCAEDRIYFFGNQKFQTYHLNSLQLSEINLPPSNNTYLSARIENKVLYTVTKNAVTLYRFQ